MTLTDTGALVALVNQNDAARPRCLQVLQQLRPPMLTTEACLAEAFHLARRGGAEPAVEALRQLVETGGLVVYALTAPERTIAFGFMRRYADRPCDYADASLLAVAQQSAQEQVFSLDADFLIYRLEDGRSVLPLPGPAT